MKKSLLLLAFTACFLSARAQDTQYALKYDFFSPVAGCFGFSFEQPRNNFISFDYDLGLIGLRLDDYFTRDKFGGAYAAFGPRLYFDRDEAQTNDLRGAYFKPQILVSYFQYQDNVDYYDYYSGLSYSGHLEGSDFSLSMLAAVGSQWIMSDLVVFDLWFGLGYGGSWANETVDIPPGNYYDSGNNNFKYSHVHFGDSPLIFDGGLSIGFKW